MNDLDLLADLIGAARRAGADLVVLLGTEAFMPRAALGGDYVERSWTLLPDGGSIAVYSRPGLPTTCTEGDPLR